MRVVITGGGGGLAHAVAATCPPQAQVTHLGRNDLDITDRAQVSATLARLRPHHVINCAAYTAVDSAETEEAKALRINGEAVADLAEECAAAGARLTQISTDFVFGEGGCTPYLPKDKPAPRNAYGRSKLAGEQGALAAGDALVVRTAWLYGVHGANFVKTMLRLMSANAEVRVVADQIGTPTHTMSLARSVWGLISAEATGLWHATDAGVASWYDFAVAIQEEAVGAGLLDREVPVVPITTADYPTPARRPAYSVLDKGATWGLLGTPARHWRRELRSMLAAMRESTRG